MPIPFCMSIALLVECSADRLSTAHLNTAIIFYIPTPDACQV